MTFFHSCLSLFLYLQGGWTPLHWASSMGHEKIVEMLVTAGADVKVKDEVRQRLTVRLWLSCRGSRRMELGGVLWLVSVVMRCCQLLSGNSCGVIFVDIFIIFSFLKDPCGCFLLQRWRLDLISGAELAHPVASWQFVMILSFSDFIFLTSGVTFFHSCLSLFLYLQGGWTPLHLACYHGHEKMVEMLVAAGADVEVKDEVRQRLTVPLWLSCRGSRRMELGGVLWLVSVVMRCCQLL